MTITPPSKTFCVLPWMHIATNASGNVRPCCNSKHGINFIKDPKDGLPYKLGKAHIEEIWQSPDYVNLRQQMLDGERPAMCERCWKEEDAGIESLRQAWQQRWIEDREYTATDEPNIKYVDLRIGNLCNLKCRMCNPYASNQWLDEWHLIADKLPDSEMERLANLNERNVGLLKIFHPNLLYIIETIEEIYFTGGEPTLIKVYEWIMDLIIDSGRAHKVKIKYNTNLTNVPKHLLEKWKKFKLIKCNVSIDATGDLDRYIRYPSNWDKIVENFLKVRQLDNVVNEIHCTVQMYNITRLHEFLDWAEPFGHKIYLNILNHPDELNIRVLPQELKDQVTKTLASYTHIDRVQGVIDYMNAEDWVDKLPKFYYYSKQLDRSRGQSLYDVLPEFKKYEV